MLKYFRKTLYFLIYICYTVLCIIMYERSGDNMFKKLFAVIATLMLMLSLCGCDLFTTDTAELLSPPSLSGDLKYIYQAINKSVKKDYTLKFASRGDYRSAVVLNDINNDGRQEAFAFYSMTDGDIVTMHISIIHKKGDEWICAGEQHIVAGGVDKIEFCDLDNDDVLDILVGWEIYGASEKQLAVYSFTEKTLSQRLLQKYTEFATCDLNQNKKKEILLIDFNPTEPINNASLIALTDDGVSQLGSCQLDSKVQSIGEPIVSTLSSGKPAVYIDSVKGVGAITEVLFFENNQLLNSLYDIELMETSKTLRSASFSTYDINGDDILEIPVQENIPSVANAEITEKLYLTNWCTFNGETLTNQLTTMINVLDGYYYIIPQNLLGNIAVLKDTDNKIREIYSYDSQNLTVGESLIYFRTFTKKQWDSGKFESLNLQEIMSNQDNVFVCKISDKAKQMGIDLKTIKNNFTVYTKE